MAFFGFLLNGRSLCKQLIHGALIEVQVLLQVQEVLPNHCQHIHSLC